MSSAKPTFIFVPGAWHGPEVFEALAAILKGKGYGTRFVRLASVGAQPPLQDFSPDVENVRVAVEEALAAGEDVVLVLHSYGGFPGAEAMKYFMDDNTGGNGRGRIIRLAWICGFVAPKGVSLHMGAGGSDPTWWKREGDLEVYPTNPQKIFYNDLPAAAADAQASKLRAHSYRTLHSPMTVEPWATIPSSYLICEKDNAVAVQGQESMISQARSTAPSSFDLVERLDASHSPFLSQPDKVAQYLERAAAAA